jgi:multicomponent Na+:H+ antiporter subunit B
MLALVALSIVRVRRLFSSAILAGIYSLLSACWMTVLDAPDVSFTEASVGAGMSTVLFLSALSLTTIREGPPPVEKRPVHHGWLPLLVVTVTGAALVLATFDMPAIGDPEAPANLHVAPRYLEDSPREMGVPNVVTSVLGSYRGYDTMGETAVVFTAGVGVIILLSGAKRRRFAGDEEDQA